MPVQIRQAKERNELNLAILNEESTFADWTERWYKMKCINLSLDYRKAIRSQADYLIDTLGEIPVNRIRPLDIQSVVCDLAVLNPHTHKPSSKRTLRGIKDTAKRIFDFICFNSDYFNRNPACKVTLPTNAPKNERRALTHKEIEWVINTSHRGRIAALIMTFCGLRSGEMIPLEWDDINFENSTLTVTKSVQKKSSNAYFVKHGTKNGKTRTIPIPDIILPILLSAKGNSDSPYICCQNDGSIHTPTSWRQVWQSYNNKLSHLYASNTQAKRNINNPIGIQKRVEKITPHLFRHTYATLLYSSGVDPLSAQRLLGHSDISGTLAIYTHLEEERYEVSVDDFCKFIIKFWGDTGAASVVR